MKFYLAFSIHGTNKFRVFIKEAVSLKDLGPEFTHTLSRRANANPPDQQKVLWSRLNTKEGKPFENPSWVSRRLKELVAKGWKEVTPLP